MTADVFTTNIRILKISILMVLGYDKSKPKVMLTCHQGFKIQIILVQLANLRWCLFFYLILNRTLIINSIKY